jgi:hypothetical protein
LACAAPPARGVLCPDLIEPRECALNIAEDEARSAGFYLRVDSPPGEYQLDIFVVLDDDVREARTRCAEQACGRVEVLIEEAAMNSFDPSKLTGV